MWIFIGTTLPNCDCKCTGLATQPREWHCDPLGLRPSRIRVMQLIRHEPSSEVLTKGEGNLDCILGDGDVSFNNPKTSWAVGYPNSHSVLGFSSGRSTHQNSGEAAL